MLKKSIIFVIISLLLMAGLAFWQISHLKKSQQQQWVIQQDDMGNSLTELSIALRKAEAADGVLQQNDSLRKAYIAKHLPTYFGRYNAQIQWAVYNANEQLVFSPRLEVNPSILNSSLKVCLSCMLMIDVLDDAEGNVTGGFVLEQTPAQMLEYNGLDNSKMEYLHILATRQNVGWKPLALPILFLLGLGVLCAWLIYFNAKQRVLITQKDEFLNHLSHQFQTPLSSIKLGAKMLANEPESNREELIQIIQTESNRLENHIKTVLHWVKSDADRLQLTKSAVDINALIENGVKQMKPVFSTNNTGVEIALSNTNPKVELDKDHIQLLLFNLWENAIKHNTEPVVIKTSTIMEQGELTIIVEDSGKGSSNYENKKFIGLGLKYVKQIAEAHNGFMEFKKSALGGLAVHLKFPHHD